MRRLYWFQGDLRLSDNPGLLAQADADLLLLVYLWPRSRPWCNVNGLGRQRERFLRESLRALRDDLQARGQDLLVIEGSPELVIPALVSQYRIDVVSTSRVPGYYERRAIESLAARLDIPLLVHQGNTLFASESLPFGGKDLPRHFTPFRQRVESLAFTQPRPAPEVLPPPPAMVFDVIPAGEARAPLAFPVRGGAEAGQRRLRQYVFDERAIASYKQTRNCLDPLDGSSTLSPWLANGCLSVREAATAISAFEFGHGRNESTVWLYLELLWREFFHRRALQDDLALFRRGKARGRLRHCTFEPRAFARWCAGDTDYPLVNALMHQLVETGWMSNRGRQIAASCLVNELQLDWRFGAAFFEKHLVDYDVASNYGNWQYIAGVGADPRGGRHFDLEKQAGEHDPEGGFTHKWDGLRPAQPAYVTDAADWPLAPE